MAFTGFTTEDFRVFEISSFAGRMAAIRGQIQPKLFALGEDLCPRLTGEVGPAVFAHVAKHMRRTVNPPDDTWLAFGPERRGYKKAQHFKVAISGSCVRFLFEVGREYPDKAGWARAWVRHAGRVAAALQRAKGIGWFKNEHDEEPAAWIEDLSPADLKGLGQELTRRKDGQLVLGRRLAAGEVSRMKPDDFEKAARSALEVLAPLYTLR